MLSVVLQIKISQSKKAVPGKKVLFLEHYTQIFKPLKEFKQIKDDGDKCRDWAELEVLVNKLQLTPVRPY